MANLRFGLISLLMLAVLSCSPRGSSQLDPAHVGKAIGGITFKPMDGEPLSSEKELKGKVVVLDFFASWCDPCLRALPRLVEMDRASRADGLALLGISLDTDPRLLRSILARHGVTYPVGLRADNESLLQLIAGYSPERLIPPIPTTAILDRQGRLQALYVGLGPGEEHLRLISAKVEQLLKAP